MAFVRWNDNSTQIKRMELHENARISRVTQWFESNDLVLPRAGITYVGIVFESFVFSCFCTWMKTIELAQWAHIWDRLCLCFTFYVETRQNFAYRWYNGKFNIFAHRCHAAAAATAIVVVAIAVTMRWSLLRVIIIIVLVVVVLSFPNTHTSLNERTSTNSTD